MGQLSTLEAGTNLANCVVGAGALALPHFFYSAGVLQATCIIALVRRCAKLTLA